METPPTQPIVLIVDDDHPIRFALRRALEIAGYEVVEAANGGEALDILAHTRQRIDVVVSDVMMPGIDGLELLERLERMHPEIPVVLASGFHTRGALQSEGAHRLAGYLDKPYDVTVLLEVVAAAIARGTDQ